MIENCTKMICVVGAISCSGIFEFGSKYAPGIFKKVKKIGPRCRAGEAKIGPRGVLPRGSEKQVAKKRATPG